MKFELGLFEHPMTDAPTSTRSAARRTDGSRQAVAESQVLLRTKGHALPLEPKRDVYVAGSIADNIGNQAGG